MINQPRPAQKDSLGRKTAQKGAKRILRVVIQLRLAPFVPLCGCNSLMI